MGNVKFKFFIAILPLVLAGCGSYSQESFLSQTSTQAEYAPPRFAGVSFSEDGNSVQLEVYTHVLDAQDFVYFGGVLLYYADSSDLLQKVVEDPIKNYEENFEKKPCFLALQKFSKLKIQTKLRNSTAVQQTLFQINLQGRGRTFLRASAVGKNIFLGWLEEHQGFFETDAGEIISVSPRSISLLHITNTAADGITLQETKYPPAIKGTDITLNVVEFTKEGITSKGAQLVPTNGVVLQNVGFKESEDILKLLPVPHLSGFSDAPCPVLDGHLIFARKNGHNFVLFIEGFSYEQLSTLSSINETFGCSVKVIRTTQSAPNQENI